MDEQISTNLTQHAEKLLGISESNRGISFVKYIYVLL
jgi:hypothetical protein